MKRRFDSGAEKRKRQRQKEKQAQQQRNALDKYITNTALEKIQEQNEEMIVKQTFTKEEPIDIAEIELETGEGTQDSFSSAITIISNEEPVRNQENIKQENEIPVNKENSEFCKDIGMWPMILTEKMKQYFIGNKPCNIGDIKNLRVEYVDRNRTYYRNISESNFYYMKANARKNFVSG